MAGKKRTLWQRHGLSIVTAGILLLWIALYLTADPQKHWGSFFGNAIADWTGMLVMVLATKYLREIGSAESKKIEPPAPFIPRSVHEFLHEHSLVIFILVTGAGWIALFMKMKPDAKWGQVVGNIVSEWTQVLGVVVLTKGLVEVGSKESK
jgi:hypothetical protein